MVEVRLGFVEGAHGEEDPASFAEVFGIVWVLADQPVEVCQRVGVLSGFPVCASSQEKDPVECGVETERPVEVCDRALEGGLARGW